MIATGLDRLLGNPGILASRRYGVLAHRASVSSNLDWIHVALAHSEAGPATVLFGPEHGFYGVEQDMVASADASDPWTGAPIHSLYGDSPDSLRPDPRVFRDLDLLLVDVQDIGSRYYTFAATAIWAAQIALLEGCEVWVLDRPNPLGGVTVEGNLREGDFESFVGAFRLPVRHGLTLAEMVLLEAERGGWGHEGLEIWPMEGWRREMMWPETGRPWIAPSPNVPSIGTCLVYPGCCLIEATELSEGRGTTRPFQLVGAPHLDPLQLVESLEERSVPGVMFVPTYFRPQYQKQRGELCGGIEIVVTDPVTFCPYRCGVELLDVVYRLWPQEFSWRRAPYEFVADRPAIDLLTGTERCRRSIEAGEGLDEWIGAWAADEESFRRERAAVLLYPGPEAPEA